MREADILVIGAGPAGLHAALKAAVLNHSVLLVDKGRRFSRVSQAPSIANIPLRPGISGAELLEEMRRDLARFRDKTGKDLVTILEHTEVLSIAREGEGWRARLRDATGDTDARARVAMLATGVVDRKPGLTEYTWLGHEALAHFLHKGLVGYCLLCEGWALEGKRVAIVGASPEAAQVADDVATQFGGDVTLLTDGLPAPACSDAVSLETRSIATLADEGGLAIGFEIGPPLRFDKALFALGWHRVNHELAKALGARLARDGHVVTDAQCEVVHESGGILRGFFAIGDVRAGPWKQIPLAWADAEIAVITAYAYRLPPVNPQGEARTR